MYYFAIFSFVENNDSLLNDTDAYEKTNEQKIIPDTQKLNKEIRNLIKNESKS